jgi:hypothetical protein
MGSVDISINFSAKIYNQGGSVLLDKSVAPSINPPLNPVQPSNHQILAFAVKHPGE